MLVTRTEGLIEAEVDGEIVALHVETGTCYGFNLPATRIWALLERPMTVEELRAGGGVRGRRRRDRTRRAGPGGGPS